MKERLTDKERLLRKLTAIIEGSDQRDQVNRLFRLVQQEKILSRLQGLEAGLDRAHQIVQEIKLTYGQ